MLDQMADVFRRLDEFVASEPALQEFREDVARLARAADAVARGGAVKVMPAKRLTAFPSRELAERVLSIIGGLPPINPDIDDPLVVRQAAQLLGGMVDSITHAIMNTFPDLITTEPGP
ncbi:MAG TPA: hypothetical protein VHO67_23005 [Polyangia bacterium]|nr:hypothetical protein [Polyangia bacterium]